MICCWVQTHFISFELLLSSRMRVLPKIISSSYVNHIPEFQILGILIRFQINARDQNSYLYSKLFIHWVISQALQINCFCSKFMILGKMVRPMLNQFYDKQSGGRAEWINLSSNTWQWWGKTIIIVFLETEKMSRHGKRKKINIT